MIVGDEMAERKCSNCRQTGHNKSQCLRANDADQRAITRAMDAVIVGVDPGNVLGVAAGPVLVKGQWHGAQRYGLCTWCGDGYEEGARIRSDGQGGWECGCVDETPNRVAEQSWQRPTAANVKMPPAPAGLFTAPRKVSDEPAQPVGFTLPSKVSAEAAPDRQGPKTERLGYICIDPVIGETRRYKAGHPKGITRVTTFVKAASNNVAITDWNKRNVLLGAAARPDIAAKAHGKDVNNDKSQLDRWVAELEEAAGGNVAANMGTDVHAWTERVDAGECGLADVPPAYRAHVQRYVETLREAGFRVVPELRERTTYVSEFGGVAGTFDAVLYHEPSDSYVLSDTKSGKNVGKYGWVEIETQEWIYAHGYNKWGTYKWGTYNWEKEEWEGGSWEPPQHQVRTDYGLVIHMPFEGDYAGTCRLLRTDLAHGETHARLCFDVRSQDAGKAVPWSLPELSWETRFETVATPAQASDLWKKAKEAGVDRMELQRLVGIAQQALR